MRSRKVVAMPMEALGAGDGARAADSSTIATTTATSQSTQVAPVAAPAKTHVDVCDVATGLHENRCFAKIRTDAAANGRRPNEIRSAADNTPALGVGGGYSPAYLQSAYDVASAAATAGGTMTVAIVDGFDAPTAEADLAVYRSFWGLPACTTANGCFRKVNQNGLQGPYPVANAAWAEEIALDVDMVSALCPNCHILLLEANSNLDSDLQTAVNRAATMGANVISNSYGRSESSADTSMLSAYNHPGIAVTVSSGDSGFGTQFPAASPNVVAVGGTSLTQNSATGTRDGSETVWAGAGSGCSAFETKPTWQTDAGCSRRTVADTSAVADPATGVWVYTPTSIGGTPAWHIFGGTSAAAPIVGAIYALAGAVSVNGASVLYTHAGSFFDITSGSNGSCSGSYLCTGVSGYDGPTGLGTPNSTSGFVPGGCTATKAAITTPTPSTTLTNTTQTFTWTTGACALEYWLYLGTSQGAKDVLDSGSLGTMLSRTASGLPTSGALWARLWMRFASGWQFNDYSYTMAAASAAPPPPTLISPSGSITTATPTYQWNSAGSGANLATWYYLWVDGPAGHVRNTWYTATQTGCSAGGVCSITPPDTLTSGAYTWWVQAWNPINYSPWSSALHFTLVTGGPPPTPTGLTPSGNTVNNPVTYRWSSAGSGDTLATFYRIWINDVTGNVLNQWYTASSLGCAGAGSVCAVTPGVSLQSGSAVFWVQAWNPNGYSAWSAASTFSVQWFGFNSQFNGTAPGWFAVVGFWDLVSNAFVHNISPANDTWTSADYGTSFSGDLDYTAAFWRNGCDGCSTALAIRGDPTLSASNDWTSAYRFQYTRNGFFSVWKEVNGTYQPLQGWTSTSAVNQGSAWNVLRVRSIGSTYYFYINGILVWIGTDSALTSGRVGLVQFGDSVAGGELWVDYAVLNSAGVLAVQANELSTEQKALNAAANKAPVLVRDGSRTGVASATALANSKPAGAGNAVESIPLGTAAPATRQPADAPRSISAPPGQ